ncbi:MAG: hypothetical protein V5A55_01495 [Halovenus sp.]
MSPTVHELRNAIRARTGRFERDVSAQFTKEELAAIAEALGHDVGDPLPSKGRMRAAIRRRTGVSDDAGTNGGAFRKAELATIADALES